MIASGERQLGPSDGRLLVKVFREGMARKMGHDLVIEVTSWSATVNVDGEDLGNSTVNATADVGSFEVREGVGGAKPLSDSDKADIKKTIVTKILRDPEISFRSTAVNPAGDNRATVTGDLAILGNTRPATLDLTEEDGRIKGTMTVMQSHWGIKPFTAFMGALKVRDPVEIEMELALPSA